METYRIKWFDIIYNDLIEMKLHNANKKLQNLRKKK